MKSFIWTLAIFIALSACKSNPNQAPESAPITLSDTLPTIHPPNPEREIVEKELDYDAEEKQGKKVLDQALKDAFRIAHKEFEADSFRKTYEFAPSDGSFSFTVEIEVGKLFGDEQSYFLVRRFYGSMVYLNLYQIKNNKTKLVIERVPQNASYPFDTIMDVNGDGKADFLVNWYPLAGCCLREIYNVYLFRPEEGDFTQDFEFINPTFSPEEHIIRGVGYGRPQDSELYKYRWNGYQVDTIEFIYHYPNHNGQYIKTKKLTENPSKKNGIVLNAIPKEYLAIEGLDWFLD